MKRKNFLAFFLFFLAGALCAVPLTTLGNIKVPTAYSLPHLMGEVSVVNYLAPQTTEDSLGHFSVEDADTEYDLAAGVNFGFYDRFTLGLVYNQKAELFLANVKIQITYETETMPAIAFGVDNLFSDVENYREDRDEKEIPGYLAENFDYSDPDDYIRNSFYAVMSKSTLLRGLPFSDYLETVIHIGFGINRFKGNVELSKQLGGLFGAIELKPTEKFSFVGEMDGYNINMGLNYMLKNFDFRLALYRMEELAQRDAKIAFNIKYTFDQFSEVKFAGKNKQFSQQSNIGQPTSRRRTITQKNRPNSSGNPLLEELERIREKRKQAEKDLEEIKKVLEEEE